MDQGRSLLMSFALSGAVMLAAPAVRAEGPSVVARLDYEAPAGCPEASTFERLVQGRTQRVIFASTGESTRFIVRVKRTSDGFSATLTRRETSGEALTGRQVRGSDCATVVDALALTAALSVDPDALLAGKSVDSSSTGNDTKGTSTPDGTKAGASSERKAPEGAEEKTDETDEPDEPEPPDEPELPDAPRTASEPARFVVGAFGGYGGWVSPGGMLLGRVTAGMVADLPLPVALELSATFGASRPLGAIDEASFELLAVAPRVCVGRLGDRQELFVRPCLSFAMGQIAAEGRDIAQPNSTRRSIFAPGAALILGAPITPELSFQLEGSVAIPLVSRRFFVGAPSNIVGETPSVAPEVVAGVTYAF